MRSDEEYVKESLEKYFMKLKCDYEIIEGGGRNRAPDYYIIHKNEKILLEVTRAEPIYKEGNKLGNRTTFDFSIEKLIDYLNKELDEKIDENKNLLLIIEGPIHDYRKFKKQITVKLISILENKNLLTQIHGKEFEIKINNNVITLLYGDRQTLKKKVSVMWGINTENSIPCINIQASIIIKNILEIKEEKTKIINGQEWHGQKWLAILNNYLLASSDIYIRAINEIEVNHNFSKIFLVERSNYEVKEIFSLNKC